MNKTSTQKDLIRYAYNETNLHDSDRIQRSIDGDPLTQQEYNEIQSVLNFLDEGKIKAPEKSMKKILAKAKQI